MLISAHNDPSALRVAAVDCSVVQSACRRLLAYWTFSLLLKIVSYVSESRGLPPLALWLDLHLVLWDSVNPLL
jgi:hypothetical protein